MTENVKSLLSAISINSRVLGEAKRRFASRLAPEFRIFDFLRTDEMGLSWCIASLLDPAGTHGQGSAFIDAFFETLHPCANWAKNTNACRVTTEKQANGQRRIDIYLDIPGAGLVGIENKPWAADQQNQLHDYAEFLKSSAGEMNWLLIYIGNEEPSKNSFTPEERANLSQSGYFVHMKYRDIVDWLNLCACKSQAPVVRVFIEELIKFVSEQINGEMDMSAQHETTNIITASPENIAAAFSVYRCIDDVKQNLLKDFKMQLSETLAHNGLGLIWEDGLLSGRPSCAGFGITFENQDEQSLYLRFEFAGSGLQRFFWGIRRKSEAVTFDQRKWSNIHEAMNKNFTTGKFSDWWPWYSDIPDHEFTASYKNWYAEEAPWLAMISNDPNESLVNKIHDLSVRVRDALRSASMLDRLS